MRALALFVALVTCSTAPAGGQELLDRTLALVGGAPITLTDVRAALALGLVAADGPGDPVVTATARLIDRELILREVQRYAPPAPAPQAVDQRLADIRISLGGAEALARLLDRWGVTALRLESWIRDDLRMQAYLAQRFASASNPSDAEISAAYARGREEFEARRLTFEEAMPIVRERLAASRRSELVADWLSDLRRRTDVVILPAK